MEGFFILLLVAWNQLESFVGFWLGVDMNAPPTLRCRRDLLVGDSVWPRTSEVGVYFGC